MNLNITDYILNISIDTYNSTKLCNFYIIII